MSIYLEIKQTNHELECDIQQMEKLLASAPEGNLGCYEEKGQLRFYLLKGGRKKYLSKKDNDLINGLILKDYCQLILNRERRKLAAGNAYVEICGDFEDELSEKLNIPEYRAHLQESAKLLNLPQTNEELLAWAKEPYEKNPYKPEALIHRALDGTYMRSKSETGIAALLIHHNIPYRYECGLQLKKHVIYPDFLIRHPKTGKLYVWEHFGMIEKYSYRQSMLEKENDYIENGYYPGTNLITTWESKDHPLDLNYADGLINYYFL